MGGLLFAISRVSERSITEATSLLVGVDQTSRYVDMNVRKFLSVARDLLDGVSHDVRTYGPTVSLEKRMMSHDDIAEISFTWASNGSEQSVLRDPSGKLTMRRIAPTGPHSFAATEVKLSSKETRPLGVVPDPRSHPTYEVLSEPENLGHARWSDLHYSQLDTHRVEVSVQEAVLLHGKSLGVARVGRWIDQLDRVGDDRSDEKRIFLCDTDGRLVTRLEPGDALKEDGDDIRVIPTHRPPEVAEALVRLRKHQLTSMDPDFLDRVKVGGETFVVSFRLLPDTQDWVVGVIIPERVLMQPMEKLRSELIGIALLLLLGAILFLGILLNWINRDLARLLTSTGRMKRLDFSPSSAAMQLRDVGEISTSLEGAKATLRAFSKYVPVDLVKLLFERNLEPHLGGEERRLTMMFTDIAGFTSVAEKLTIPQLAERLGDYLQLMSRPIQSRSGAILERVGDALLVIWNAPSLVEDHPRLACLAALECRAASEELGWHTRFGIHTDEVMVGHFGSHERMNYGVLGDGVNLASRIEGLNKHYGTSILVSRTVAEAVPDGLEFRLVDRVAVKGRTQGIELYELMGITCQVSQEALRVGEVYERAFRHYLEGRFAEAQAVFESLPNDPPARTLATRCRIYAASPPSPQWGGVFVASFK